MFLRDDAAGTFQAANRINKQRGAVSVQTQPRAVLFLAGIRLMGSANPYRRFPFSRNRFPESAAVFFLRF